MLIEFPHFEGYLIQHNKESLLKKGKDFMKKKFVKHIHAFSGNEWDVYVESERPGVPGYTVRIRIQGGKVTHRNCNCLGFRFNPLCKHIVAALTAIRAEDLYDSDIGEYEAEETDEEVDMESEKKKKSAEKDKDEGRIEEEPEKKQKGKSAEKSPIKTPQKKEEPKKRRIIPSQRGLIDRELECQTCKNTVKDPITLPCQAHSICLKCAESLLEKAKKDKDGAKDLSCPSCGKKEGVFKIKDMKDLKANRELERVRHAYDKEKENWLKEKEKLEKELNELRASQKGSTQQSKQDTGEMEEEKSLQDKLKDADTEKLKEVTEAAFYKLKNDGESMEELIEDLKDNKKKVQKSGSAQKKGDTKKNKEEDQIQIKVQDKTPKGKGKSGSKGGKKETTSGKTSGKGQKGVLEKKENEEEGQEGSTKKGASTGKRGRTTETKDKENAEGSNRYELRNKKVKTYAE